KAITHSVGGILIEHFKYLAFHQDVKKGERCFWYTTTGWMMWNYIQSSLLLGATMVLYDGSPAYPTLDRLWQYAEEVGLHHFGTSAGFLLANAKEGFSPKDKYDLSELRSIGSTGSTLPDDGFDYVYDHIKKNIWLTSISGGTDVCTAFVGGNPLGSVYRGEIQTRALGCYLLAYDEQGVAVEQQLGEMVIKNPMPSMPIYFWSDTDDQQYRQSYFEKYPEIWRQGDWVEITTNNGVKIFGRSDATLNRGGVRIGTSEVYSAIADVKGIKDSLVICLEQPNGDFFMPLFVVLEDEKEVDEQLIKNVANTIRSKYTPRHVPDQLIQVKDIPYTISGKKLETPIKKILMGMDASEVVNFGALKNPDSIKEFEELRNNFK
ncbi:MAG: AMP-binding protein, partial [Reichenbachiella sp.]